MIEQLYYGKENFEGYCTEKDSLANLSKVNIFIGQNNSGKSRFLRGLFTTTFGYDYHNGASEFVYSKIETLKQEISRVFQQFNLQEIDDLVLNLSKLHSPKGINNDKSYIGQVRSVFDTANNLAMQSEFVSEGRGSNLNLGNRQEIINQIKRSASSCGIQIDKYIYNNEKEEFDKIYIPILRGLRPVNHQFDSDGKIEFDFNDSYLQRTNHDYKIPSELHRKIFTGLNIYQDTKKLLLGKRQDRDKIRAFEEFLSTAVFEQNVSLVPNINDDVLYISIGEEEERPVYDLGDGVQSIICILYPLFFNKDSSKFVFIEEPENFLHPGMQRILMNALMLDEFKDFQFFITTHSNHFLDISLDFNNISIYSFHKKKTIGSDKPEFIIENVNNEDLSVLELIGVRNSSVFLSNCTIWVEGITDRLYFNKILDVTQDHLRIKQENRFKEDLHYSFVEYGGNNIVHWEFGDTQSEESILAKRLNQRIMLIADSDNTEEKPDSKKAKRYEHLGEVLGDRFCKLQVKEVENLLSFKIIKEVVLETEGLKPDEEDYKRIDDIQEEDYSKKSLGLFIEEKFKPKKSYAEESGTIKNKIKFCKIANSKISGFDDLSEEAKELGKRLCSFIKSQNDY